MITNNEPHQLPPKIESFISSSKDSYNLSFLHSNNYIKNRVALIGDAAHRVHPTAGQGVTFGKFLANKHKLKLKTNYIFKH